MKQFCDSAARRRQVSIADRDSGITLIEMLIVLAIIAIVAGAVVMSGILGRPDEARATTTKSDLATIATALKTYRLDNGFYPTTEQGLDALVTRPANDPAPSSWPAGGYLSDPPVDAWGRKLIYTATPDGFMIKSLGRDGKPGGEGVDADIEKKG